MCGAPPRPLWTQWPAVQTTLRLALSTSVAEQTQSVPSGRFEKSRPIVRVPGRSVVTGFAPGLRLVQCGLRRRLRFWRWAAVASAARMRAAVHACSPLLDA